ncbi:hypothetical protein PIB30_091851, partial [Stylosanthes scabra]|nr:hypothetical protein [Stylosanthes scabra]
MPNPHSVSTESNFCNHFTLYSFFFLHGFLEEETATKELAFIIQISSYNFRRIFLWQVYMEEHHPRGWWKWKPT